MENPAEVGCGEHEARKIFFLPVGPLFEVIIAVRS